jgi:hypothetical protein
LHTHLLTVQPVKTPLLHTEPFSQIMSSSAQTTVAAVAVAVVAAAVAATSQLLEAFTQRKTSLH